MNDTIGVRIVIVSLHSNRSPCTTTESHPSTTLHHLSASKRIDSIDYVDLAPTWACTMVYGGFSDFQQFLDAGRPPETRTMASDGE